MHISTNNFSNTGCMYIFLSTLIENWLNDHSQRVLQDGEKISWRPVSSGASQGSKMGPVLFHTFMNDLCDGVECTFRKFALIHQRVVPQRDLNTGEMA